MNDVKEDIHSRNPLLFFSFALCLTRGLGYTFNSQVKGDLPDGLAKLAAFLGIWMYGVLWLVAAAVCVWLALSRVQSYLAITFASLPAFIWAIAYGVGWVHIHDRLWIAAFLYWAVSGLIFWAGMTKPKAGWHG